MSARQIVLSTALLVLLACPVGVLRAAEPDADANRSIKTVFDYLTVAGAPLDLRFTLERRISAGPDDPLVGVDGAFRKEVEYWRSGPRDHASIDALLAFVRKSRLAEHLTFKRDKKYRRVVHVIDKRLIGLEGYAVERRVNVEFAGLIDQIFIPLQKQVNNLVWKYDRAALRFWMPGGLPADDGWTEIAVTACNESIRSVLTSAVPIDAYGPYLWYAATDPETTPPTTSFGFVGMTGFDDAHEDQLSWPWWQWLQSHAAPLGCHFTIETAYRNASDPEACPVFIGDKEQFESADDLVKALTERIPWLTAVRNVKRPQIIHLIDRELLPVEGYALEAKHDMVYEGTPHGFALQIAKTVEGVEPDHYGLEGIGSGDRTSHIKVHATNSPLRDIMTDCIPVTKKCGVLWKAKTWKRERGAVTRIIFP